MTLRIALAQIPVEHGKPEENYKKVDQYLSKAAQAKADVVVLPELWNTGYDLARLEEIADVEGSELKNFYKLKHKTIRLTLLVDQLRLKRMNSFTIQLILLINKASSLVNIAKYICLD